MRFNSAWRGPLVSVRRRAMGKDKSHKDKCMKDTLRMYSTILFIPLRTLE
jgi:hypothetical protein